MTNTAPCDLVVIQRRQLATTLHDDRKAGAVLAHQDVPALIEEALAHRSALQWCFDNLVEIEAAWGSERSLEELRSLIATLRRVPSVETSR